MPGMDEFPTHETASARRRRRRRDATIYITAVLVTVMFIVWVALGSVTVARQNRQILEGVQAQLDQAGQQFGTVIANQQAILHDNQDNLHAVVCILQIDPDQRTPAKVNQCLADNGIAP